MKARNHLLIGALASSALALSGVAGAQQSSVGSDPNTADGNVMAQSGGPSDRPVPASSASGDGAWSSSGDRRFSVLPYTRNGYVGLSLGASDYRVSCGMAPFCDDADLAGRIYTGGMINRGFGIEFAYLNFGWTERAGGRTRAQGLNLSAVGRLPLHGDTVALFAKGGATYGRSNTRATPASGIATGKETGWGPSFGAGLSFNVSPRLAVVAEWERHRFEFAGDNDDWVDLTSVGMKYQF